ncbi:hypothetical protein BH23VER1_BH23VER1_34920 [soil metagenome]
MNRTFPRLRIFAGFVLLVAGFYLALIPEFITIRYIFGDAGLGENRMPKFAKRLHRSLSPGYAAYAKERVASGAGETVELHDIAGTEWPLFGSCFYLWATEALQDAWEEGHRPSEPEPARYAREAIDAATALVLDPKHATWVKEHYGESDYLRRDNCFYRMLVISAMASHARLTGETSYLPHLRDMVARLAREIDESPHGLIEDYPDQCYPADVVAALAAIKRADAVLGTDHGDVILRGIRLAAAERTGPIGLPPYAASAASGAPLDNSRGCANAYLATFAPDIWPTEAAGIYETFVEHFWQQNAFVAGFREFPAGGGREKYFDVDAGPVVGGLGTAATAFGLGAARANGRFDHARPIGAQMIAASWPLADGTLLVPRILSFAGSDHAPYLGETAILFQMTRRPAYGTNTVSGADVRLPLVVVAILSLEFAVGLLLAIKGVRMVRGR